MPALLWRSGRGPSKVRLMTPRIPPGSRKEIGAVNALAAAVIGRMAGTGPPNVFTTLGRNRRLFRRWLFFAGALMPGGKLPRADTELLILRVAHSCRSSYEWDHHARLARTAGLTSEEIERVRGGPDADGWTPRQAVLLRAADELHVDRVISDDTWIELGRYLSAPDLIEFCLLVGHYEMLAMTLNSLGVEHDAVRRPD
jgi:alkylhydroperoxidase family enzyme